VAADDIGDPRPVQPVKQRQKAFAGDRKDAGHAVPRKLVGKDLAAVAHGLSPSAAGVAGILRARGGKGKRAACGAGAAD
jgi:hypothetical protein